MSLIEIDYFGRTIITQKNNTASDLIDLEKLKYYFSINGSSDDALLTDLIEVAINYFERKTGHDIILKTKENYLCNFSNFKYNCIHRKTHRSKEFLVKANPLKEVLSIHFLKDDNYILLSNTEYRIVNNNEAYFLIKTKNIEGFPTEYDVDLDGTSLEDVVKITYKSGYDSDLPTNIRQTIYYLTQYLYDNRTAGGCDCNDINNAFVLQTINEYRASSRGFICV